MANHSSIFAWRMLQRSLGGCKRVRHDLATKQQALERKVALTGAFMYYTDYLANSAQSLYLKNLKFCFSKEAKHFFFI